MYATHETKPLVEAVQSQCWNHSSGPPYTPGLASQYANRVQRKIWSTIPTILVENAGGLEQGSRCYVTGVIKVTDHSFGSLWVYVICQIMWQEKGCSSQAETWQVKNILMKDYDWQVKCDVFVVSMATWTNEYNLQISLLLSLHKICSLDFPINLHTAYYNY